MPTKVTPVRKSFPAWIRQTTTQHGTSVSGTFYPYSWQNTRTGDRVLRWKDKIRKGENATGPLSGAKYDLKGTRGLVFQTLPDAEPLEKPPYFGDIEIEYEGYHCRPAILPQVPGNVSSAASKAENQALFKLLQQIRAARTHFDGITFFGELKESIKLVSSVSKGIARMIPGYVADQKKLIGRHLGSFEISPYTGLPVRVRGRSGPKPVYRTPKEWETFRKNLYDRYLAFAFGVRPLLTDVKGAAETIARFQHDERRTVARGYGEVVTDKIVTRSFETVGTSLNAVRVTTKVTTFKCILRAGVRFEAEVPAFGSAMRLAELSGFTLENFVPSIWNLLPSSFLVDYFFNVGDVLEATFTDKSGIIWISKTNIRENVESAYLMVAGGSGNIAGNFLGSYEATARLVGRAPLASLPVPAFETTVPDLLSLKWLNISALMGSGAYRSRYGRPVG